MMDHPKPPRSAVIEPVADFDRFVIRETVSPESGFVSKYQLSLPDKEEMRRFIEEQMEVVLGSEVGISGGEQLT